MTSMTEHPANKDVGKSGLFKGLIVGDSGAGKSGALASLVDAGYKLRILDFDGGLDPLAGYVKDKSKLKNVDYQTLRDEFKNIGSTMSISKAASFQRAMSLLQKWEDYGPVSSWGPDTVLVVDTLGKMGRSSLNMVLQANGIVGKNPEIQHWGTAMDNVEKVLGNLTHQGLVPCHLIVNTHITYQEDGTGVSRGYPEALGNKLNPKVARDFNNMITLSISAGQRSFKVRKDGMFACKTSRPMSKETYPVETGLADIFLEIVGPPPKS